MDIIQSDALEWLKAQANDSIDLIFSSPPYEAQRTYGIGKLMSGEEWVAWMKEIWIESNRVCKGLVCYVVEGSTKKFRYSATPLLLGADLHRAGIRLRKPPIFHRVGIPGSGGPDWWRNDYEFVLCSSKGKLPWSDNTATGRPNKYAPGGRLSHRTVSGERVCGHGGRSGEITADRKQIIRKNGGIYTPPDLANPGNVLKSVVGGGKMGSPLAHENEAPFPESLVEPFIKCFCPPGGIVADPFIGSGTTAAVAKRLGRRCIGCDVRQNQVDLTYRRLQDDPPS